MKPPLCAVVASALANRYPTPTVVGYKGEGEFDAKKAHIAKLRSIKRYLDTTPGAKDDDLVVIVDGFDVLAQIPANAMIERYFETISEADRRLADLRGTSVEQLHADGLRQTIIFGADKGCFPQDTTPGKRDARCWMVPYSTLPRYKWGPKTENGELVYSEPRFLNSGTVMGPLGDLRTLIDASLDLIKETWDKDYRFKNSDQYYLSNIYARQEYQRVLDLNGGMWPGEVPENHLLPKKKKGDSDRTEYHVFLDFDSSFTQTQCHNDRFMAKLKYDYFDHTAITNIDRYEEGDKHRPFKVQMPAFIYQAYSRIYDSLLDKERTVSLTDKWVKSLELGTNVGTRQIYGFYHNTCSKRAFVDKYQKSWFFPLIRPLLRAGARAIQAEEPIHTEPLDGRMWMAPRRYPINEKGEMLDDFGGVFTDHKGEEFIPLQKFCEEDLAAIIK